MSKRLTDDPRKKIIEKWLIRAADYGSDDGRTNTVIPNSWPMWALREIDAAKPAKAKGKR